MRGFTVVELLIVMAIVAVLVAIAAPNMRNFIDAQVVKAPASDLYSSLVLARSEAIKRNAAIDLVPNATDWAAGWAVKVQGAGTVLRAQDPVNGVAITASTAGTVTYGSNGRLSTSATVFRVRVPSSTTTRMRCVTVDVTGRPSVRVDTNTDQAACD